MGRIEDLRNFFDSHDASSAMESGHWEDDVVDDPMVTTSLRLPKSLLDWVRQQAEGDRVKTSAWIRALLEKERDREIDSEHAQLAGKSLDRRVSALESAVLYLSEFLVHDKDTDSGSSIADALLVSAPTVAGKDAMIAALQLKFKSPAKREVNSYNKKRYNSSGAKLTSGRIRRGSVNSGFVEGLGGQVFVSNTKHEAQVKGRRAARNRGIEHVIGDRIIER